MKTLLLISVSALISTFAQAQTTPGTLQYPNAQDTADSLYRAADNATTVLQSQLLSSGGQINVNSTSGFQPTGVVVIESEQIIYTTITSTSFSGLVRGVNGTSAASHNAGVLVRAPAVAAQHNLLAQALIALENKVGVGASTPMAGLFLRGNGAGTSAWSGIANGDLPSNISISGNLTAAYFIGNCSLCSGITGATGGVNNSGTTTISSTSGNLSFQTAGVEQFRINNNGTAIFNQPVQLPVQDSGGQMWNVKAFGAKGDGVNNDGGALQVALNTASTAGGGLVYCPPGTYLFTTGITWPGSNVSLVGAGRGLTTLLFNVSGGTGDTSSVGISIAGTSGSNINGVRIANLTIKGASAASDSTTYELITVADYVNDSIFDNLEFANARHSGLRYTSSSPGNRTWVTNSYFHDIDNSAMTGINGGAVLGGYPSQKIQGCHFSNVGNNSGFHGVYIGTFNDAIVTENSFVGLNADFQYNGGTSPFNLNLTSNIFDGTANVPINTVSSGTVSGNTFYNANLSLGTCTNLLVGGNMFVRTTDASTSSISANGAAANIHVSGNTFLYTGGTGASNTSGIVVTGTGANDWTISGNYFKGFSFAIEVANANNASIFGNEIKTTSSGDSVILNSGTNHVVRGNVIEVGGSGRPITDSTGALIEGNAFNTSHGTSGLAPNRRFAGYATTTQTSTYTVTRSDSMLLLDATSAAFTVTLPHATSQDKDMCITLKRVNSGSNAVTVAAYSPTSQTIDGAATKTLNSQYATITLVFDGAGNWNIVSEMGTVI